MKLNEFTIAIAYETTFNSESTSTNNNKNNNNSSTCIDLLNKKASLVFTGSFSWILQAIFLLQLPGMSAL